MPKVMYDEKGHRCQRMYGREYKKGATVWKRTDFYYCPVCKQAYDEREMRVEEVQHVRVLRGYPISMAVGEVEVPGGTVKGKKPDKKGYITMYEDDLRQLLGEELDKRLKAGKKNKR